MIKTVTATRRTKGSPENVGARSKETEYKSILELSFYGWDITNNMNHN
jgi:hypothetical protein